MFLLNGNTLPQGTPFKDAQGTQYPANWLNLSTEQEKTAIGITEVTDPAFYDDRFYWGVNIPKDVDQVKANLISQTNATAYSILLPSDWMVVKAFETSTPVITAWSTWRSAIRTEAATQISAINACTTTDQLAALPGVSWSKDPNAPVTP
jgi:hypothetical protein